MKCFNHRFNGSKILLSATALSGALMTVACTPSSMGTSSGDGSNSSQSAPRASFDANAYDMTKVVCDINSAQSPQHGLLGRLYSKPSSAPDITEVSQIEGLYMQSEQSLFFNSVNVPTRIFDQGFVTASGALVKDDQGNTLIENFGLVMTAQLQLGANDISGNYEFALLSDDGATLEIQNDDGSWKMVVNDDLLHPTQMGCSTNGANPTVQLLAGHIYNIRIHYFQGPRTEIANVLIWKPVGAGQTAANDPLCGQNGNYLYFDPDHGSAPTQGYVDLLTRGWSVVPAGDFYLPNADLTTVSTMDFNPCYTATSPSISGAQVISSGNGEITVEWLTDQPATGQVIVKDVNGNSVALSVSDNLLTTSHLVTVTGLPANLVGEVQVVSYSATQGMAMSSPIPVTLH